MRVDKPSNEDDKLVGALFKDEEREDERDEPGERSARPGSIFFNEEGWTGDCCGDDEGGAPSSVEGGNGERDEITYDAPWLVAALVVLGVQPRFSSWEGAVYAMAESAVVRKDS